MLSQLSSQRLGALPPTQPPSQLLRGRRLPFLHRAREKLQFGCHGHKGTPGLYSFWRTVLILLPGAEPIPQKPWVGPQYYADIALSLRLVKRASCHLCQQTDSRTKTKAHGGSFLWHQLPTERAWEESNPHTAPPQCLQWGGNSINTWGGTEEEDNISGKILSFVEHLCPPRNMVPTVHHVVISSVNMAVTDSFPLALGQAFVRALSLIPLGADFT